ncbi:MAG TPA: PQQ-binding-like beta-propeller repeat protein [Streptosporangiaceae bacterium]|nr:PQQ-binding-like beta-propeller repeat protein [Streptosporangiaceae bacterium]
MNTEERQLTEMLHRITPEPPRRVTLQDIAFRLADQAGPDPRPRYRGRPDREPRLRRPSSRGWSRAWAPALAAASVFVVAGATAGIAVLASSHHSPPAAAPATRDTTSGVPASSPTVTPASTSPAGTVTAIPGAPWHARLIDDLALQQGSLTGSGDSLYAFTGQDLVRIDPATGAVLRSAAVSSAVLNAPVVVGGTVWVVSSYDGGRAVLDGYNAQTLDRVSSVMVPAVGQVSSAAQGVLAAGPDGNLYVAAGDSVAVVNPANGAVVGRIMQPAGPAGSVAVSPDGSRLYASTFFQSGEIFQLLTYDLTQGGMQVGSSHVSTGAGGNLVATEGGVWGTLGTGTSQWAWFAPGGDLSSASPVIRGTGGGLVSLPTLAGGALWIGGTQSLACANPATGSVRESAAIPGDHGVAVYFGSVAYAGGHAYAYYIDGRSQAQGVTTFTPPAGCTR